MARVTDWTAVTACGEDCTGCAKRLAAACPGCIAADGVVPEWAGSGRCRVHACTRSHGVPFCGLCAEFPCAGLAQMIPWNPQIMEHQRQLAEMYREWERSGE